ncbi:MAG: helix-turn-helix transcriptional regulator [Defluviitaleaceae bacterium]|nr:helix-turn-helix transcriptional regulator [Defluviitaleaceae bacterium]
MLAVESCEPVSLKAYLSANIKARREILGISQEKLAELADVSVQTIKGIEGRRTWVGDQMLANLAGVLGVSAFQLLVPTGMADSPADNTAMVSGILDNLKRNIQDDINRRFEAMSMRNG